MHKLCCSTVHHFSFWIVNATQKRRKHVIWWVACLLSHFGPIEIICVVSQLIFGFQSNCFTYILNIQVYLYIYYWIRENVHSCFPNLRLCTARFVFTLCLNKTLKTAAWKKLHLWKGQGVKISLVYITGFRIQINAFITYYHTITSDLWITRLAWEKTKSESMWFSCRDQSLGSSTPTLFWLVDRRGGFRSLDPPSGCVSWHR